MRPPRVEREWCLHRGIRGKVEGDHGAFSEKDAATLSGISRTTPALLPQVAPALQCVVARGLILLFGRALQPLNGWRHIGNSAPSASTRHGVFHARPNRMHHSTAPSR